MSEQDAFDRILAAAHDAMLDETRWPATSALIDEACGLTGNGLMVGEGPKNASMIGLELVAGLYPCRVGNSLTRFVGLPATSDSPKRVRHTLPWCPVRRANRDSHRPVVGYAVMGQWIRQQA